MIKKHWTAVLISLILGFLMVLPFFYFQKSLGEEYKGILNQVIDDEIFYMARIKDVIDGHPTLGNAYLAEYKNQLPQQLFLPELILAQPLKLFPPTADQPKAENFDIIQGRILYNFLLPAIAFLLTYIAFYLIYHSKLWANLFSIFLIFGLYLFKFTRPVIPQFVFIFWLTQFIFLWLLVRNKGDDIMIYHRISKKWVLLLNILNFGLLFYLYPFYWTFYLVFFAVLILTFFRIEKKLSKQFLKILIGGLIIALPYFYLTFLTSRLPEYQETLTRLQLVYSRSPSEFISVFRSFVVLLLIGVLYRLKTVKLDKKIIFFLAGIVSILLVTNQNIITGQKFEFGHYRMPATFFLVFAVYCLWSKINFKEKLLVASFIILISASGLYEYTQRITKVSEEDIYRQRYAVIFDWLNENIPKDSVVYANEDISGLIPIYTANNVFYSRYANLFIISDDEAGERFVLNNYFEKFDRDFAVQNERAIWGVRYVDRYADVVQANKWRKILGLGLKDETRLPEQEINKILAAASQIQKDFFEKGLKKYRVDYFVWDKNKNFDWQLANQNFLEKAFEDENFAIYQRK